MSKWSKMSVYLEIGGYLKRRTNYCKTTYLKL